MTTQTLDNDGQCCLRERPVGFFGWSVSGRLDERSRNESKRTLEILWGLPSRD